MADDKTFTQAEMDSIIEGRLAREREKYADYDSLKDKAGKYDEMQAKEISVMQHGYSDARKQRRRCTYWNDTDNYDSNGIFTDLDKCKWKRRIVSD